MDTVLEWTRNDQPDKGFENEYFVEDKQTYMEVHMDLTWKLNPIHASTSSLICAYKQVHTHIDCPSSYNLMGTEREYDGSYHHSS